MEEIGSCFRVYKCNALRYVVIFCLSSQKYQLKYFDFPRQTEKEEKLREKHVRWNE